MSRTPHMLVVFFLVAIFISMVALSGVAPVRVVAQSAQPEEDPDLPLRMRGLIDKAEYLQRRNAFASRLRGIPYDLPYNPRVRAIQEMERQERAQLALAPEISTGRWDSIGPAPIPNGQTEGTETSVSGRTISIAIDPTNPNLVYVGTAQGGVYRSTNGGMTWLAILDSALSLSIGALALAPSDPTILYVGTGEPNFSCDSFFGVGVYRIRNANTTPTVEGPFNLDAGMNDVFTGRSIGKIVVHPTEPDIIFVSSTTGIGGIGCDLPSSQPSRGLFRSMNALDPSPTFEKLNVATANAGNRSITDVVMEPDNPNNLVCSVVGFNGPGDGGIYRSTDALAANPVFTRTLTIGTAVSIFRTELAINKVGAVVTVFAASAEPSGSATCNNAGQAGLLRKSTDGGLTWSAAIAAGNGFCGTQCSYDIAVAVDPNNANNVIIGGNVTSTCSKLVARSTNGGTSFTNVSNGVHADNHAVVFAPSNTAIAYMGTDGGIYKTTDGGATWMSLNNVGFSATQFQSLALHPSDREFMIGGTQDNGTVLKRPDGTWTRADFGDGGFALIDQSAADTTNVTMYHTYFNISGFVIGFGRVNTSTCATEGEWAFRGIFNGMPFPGPVCDGSNAEAFNGIALTDDVLFYAPMALGPGTPNTLYFGTDRLYRSINKGDTMVLASQAPLEAGVPVSAIGISPQNDNVRIAGLANGNIYVTTTGSSVLTEVSGPIPSRYIARAVIDPTNANTAYVTLAGFGLAAGQHVWKTTNLNAMAPTWVAVGGSIPDVPVNAFVIDPANTNHLYAGTDIGVYRSTDGGMIWSPFNNGLPRVAVFDMAIQATHRVLRIATHGRGIWEISISRFNLPRTSQSFPANGGVGSVEVNGPDGLAWTAVSNDPWITVTSPGPGSGTGTVLYTVASHASTSGRVGSITIANQTFTVLQGGAFLDVPESNPFYTEIGKLAARGVTLGCGGGNYCPAQQVTREQMAAFIIRALGDFSPLPPPSQRFADVPPANVFYAFIEQMAIRQITLGCGGGNYCPSDPVLRDQMAAFIIRALGEFNPPQPAMQRFLDVPPTNVFYAFIDRMAVLQITLGCGGGNYCPAQPVTRDQMAAFLVRAFNL